MQLSQLDTLATRQHGVVARRQTTLTESAWRRAVNAGTLLAIHPGVARLVGTAQTPEQRIVAAVLAAGPGAMASHRSAAHLHGIPGLADSPDIDVIVRPALGSERAINREGPTDVHVHRPRDLRRLTPARVNDIPCTDVLRTLVDLGAVTPKLVSGAVGHVLANELATLAAIETARDQHSARGRSGLTALRLAIDDWAIDGKPADSVLEPALRRIITRYRLPPVEFHPIVGGREVDFRIIGTPIVIECDGWAYHGRSRPNFERDRAMDAEFASHGWIVIRFTYRRITQRPSDVADVISRTIARWADAPTPDSPAPDAA